MTKIEENIVSILKSIGLLLVVGYLVLFISPFLLIFGVFGLVGGSYVSGIVMITLAILSYRIYWICMRGKKYDIEGFRRKIREASKDE